MLMWPLEENSDVGRELRQCSGEVLPWRKKHFFFFFAMAEGDAAVWCCHGEGDAEGRNIVLKKKKKKQQTRKHSEVLPWWKGTQRHVEEEEAANTKNVAGAVVCHDSLLLQLP
ncbi:hypothetical protein S83_031576 [Arachis hypogaea]